MDDNLGNRIKQLRQRANMTQMELARRLQVSSALISAYELGERNPSLKILTELADTFQVSSDYLLGISSSSLRSMDTLSYEETLAVQAFIKYITQSSHIEDDSSEESV